MRYAEQQIKVLSVKVDILQYLSINILIKVYTIWKNIRLNLGN